MPFVRHLVVAAVMGMALLPVGRDGPPGAQAAGCEPIAVDGTTPAGTSRVSKRIRPDDTVRIDLSSPLGPVNQKLTGVVWNAGGSLAALAPVHPAIVRIDASLQDRSRGPAQLDRGPG